MGAVLLWAGVVIALAVVLSLAWFYDRRTGARLTRDNSEMQINVGDAEMKAMARSRSINIPPYG